MGVQSEWSENPLSTDFWLNWPLIAVFGGASLDTVGEQFENEEDVCQNDDFRGGRRGVIFANMTMVELKGGPEDNVHLCKTLITLCHNQMYTKQIQIANTNTNMYK